MISSTKTYSKASTWNIGRWRSAVRLTAQLSSLYPVPCGPLTYQNEKKKNESRMERARLAEKYGGDILLHLKKEIVVGIMFTLQLGYII